MSPEEQTFDETSYDSEVKKSINETLTLKNSLTRPLQVFKVSDDDGVRILSLTFQNTTLIVGTNHGKICGYSWYKKRLTKKIWEIYIPSKNVTDQNDINCFWLQKEDAILYVGCGDNNVYAVDIENGGKVIRSFKNHTDYIHWIDGSTNNSLYSASEDGSINFWDRRSDRLANHIVPYKDERLERQQFGKWQGTVFASENWLICGGGPKPCLYHLRSLECSVVFDFNSTVHVSGFLDDIVYIGGDNNHLYQYNLKGDLTARIPVSSSSIYSVVSQSMPEKLLSIAGSSNYLDVCTNYNYRDILLQLYETPKKRY